MKNNNNIMIIITISIITIDGFASSYTTYIAFIACNKHVLIYRYTTVISFSHGAQTEIRDFKDLSQHVHPGELDHAAIPVVTKFFKQNHAIPLLS